MNSLRDEIIAIVKAISDGNDRYWNNNGWFSILDQATVVADILAAVVEHDGEEALEAFGGG